MYKADLERGWMIYKHLPIKLVCAIVALFMAILGGCSPEFHKNKADKEVYKIIDEKWHPAFGEKANYIIADSNIPSPRDIKYEGFPVMPEKLSLAQAVAIATVNSRNYKSQKETLYLTALGLSDVRHNYEAQLFGISTGARERIYTEVSDSDGTETRVTDGFSHTSSLGVQQEFLLSNGIDITTELAVEWMRFLTGDPKTSLGSILTTSVTVPLLGAGGGKQKLETLIQRERDVVYTVRDFNRFRQTFVVDTINAYYGVLQQRDAVTNAQNNYQRVLESKNRLEMEAEAGRRTRIDVDEARQSVLSAESSLVQAQQRYERFLDAFKFILAIPTDANIELDQNELIALREMGVTEPGFALDEAVETALLRRLDLANTADRIDDNLRKTVLFAEGLGPQLDFITDIDYSSPQGEQDFQNLRLHEGNYSFGYNLDLPLDRKFQRNDYRAALIALEQQKRRYDEDVDSVKLQVRDAYRQLVQTAEQYRIQLNSFNLATQRVESNKLLLDAGRVTVRILLDSQDALVQAENAVTAALVNHLDAKLSFYRDVGILQVKPDGMWAQLESEPGKQKNDTGKQSRANGNEENL